MQIQNNSPAFTSVHLPYKKIPLSKPLDLIEPYFELKGFCNIAPEKVRAQITGTQAGVVINKNELSLIGKDREAEEFIARQMKKGNMEHTYVQDTPETKFEGPIIDMTI